ncbi:MAG: hypothetical protein GXO21_03160 [Aquificae bacterium]|nr:hypothetical protein [Aquificota bacterium]
MKRKLIAALLVSTTVSFVQAKEIYVSPKGIGDCSKENPCEIQIGLYNASTNGEDDIIYLQEGVYKVNNLIYAPPTDEGNLIIEGRGDVILDGNKEGRILQIDTFVSNDDGKNITIKNISFVNGKIEGENKKGAGLFIKTKYANITIEDCKFEGNIATIDADGGGLYIQTNTGNISIINSTFKKNTSQDYGGGFDVNSLEGTIKVSHCIVEENEGGYGGGGSIETSIGRVEIINNIIVKNKSDAAGGGRGGGILLTLKAGKGFIVNNTFVENTSSAYGGGFHIKAFDNNGKAYIYNNIIYNNSAEKFGKDAYIETEIGNSKYEPTIKLENNNFENFFVENLTKIKEEGKFDERFNISADPMFVGYYHLDKNSPLIDRGVIKEDIPLPERDIDLEPRISRKTVDIGADEVFFPTGNNSNSQNNTSMETSGEGGGGCSLSSSASSINALLYLALPFLLLVRRFLRG